MRSTLAASRPVSPWRPAKRPPSPTGAFLKTSASLWIKIPLPRRIRFWEKKRGHRRTGSPALANAGEVVFFASVVLLAFFALVIFVTSRVVEVDHVSTWTQGARFWIGLLILASVILMGAYGLVRSVFQIGTSAERRSMIAQRAQAIGDPATGKFDSAWEYPSVPKLGALMESPGTRLAYRLPQLVTPAWSLHALALFSLMWLGVLAVVLVVVTQSFLAGQPRWILLVVTFLLAAVAVRVTQSFLVKLGGSARVGPTSVEISRMPLRPGQQAMVSLTQSGRMSLVTLQLLLVCEEEAIFREGTNLRVEQARSCEQSVLAENNLTVSPQRAFQLDGPLHVPADVMHSFESPSNSIRWQLLVRGRQTSGTGFERRFSVVVYPPIVRSP